MIGEVTDPTKEDDPAPRTPRIRAIRVLVFSAILAYALLRITGHTYDTQLFGLPPGLRTLERVEAFRLYANEVIEAVQFAVGISILYLYRLARSSVRPRYGWAILSICTLLVTGPVVTVLYNLAWTHRWLNFFLGLGDQVIYLAALAILAWLASTHLLATAGQVLARNTEQE